MAAAKQSPTASDVRTWAVENGITVGARGCIPASVVSAFNKGKRGAAKYTPAYLSA